MIRTAAAAIIATSLLSLGATSATAQQSKPKTRDLNEVVCKKEDVLGSRLQSRKVCMTRGEWAEQRQLDRQNVERSQTNTCQRQAGC
jgi:transposase-like protein